MTFAHRNAGNARFVFCLWILLGLPAAALAAAPAHPFTAQDLMNLQRISDPQVAPDGTNVAFTVGTPDLAANRVTTDVWIADLDSQRARPLTNHPAADYGPRWSPDGHWLYFLSARSGSVQVYRLSLSGGEPEPISHLPLDVDNLVISPDGRTLVVSMDVYPDCPDLACTVDRNAQRTAGKRSGLLYEQLFVRHWDTWSDGTRRHLFALSGDGRQAVDLMRGMDVDAPTKPMGGTEELAFAPDSRSLVFVAKDVGRQEAWSTNTDLFVTALDASAAPRNLTVANQAADSQPRFSPDGRTLAYLAMSRAGYESDRQRIVLQDWPAGHPRVLTEGWDRSAEELAWATDGSRLIVAAANLGQLSLFAVSRASGQVTLLLKDGQNMATQVVGKRLVFLHDSLLAPAEVWTSDPSGQNARPVTHLNAQRLATMKMGAGEQFTFKGAHGDDVWAYLVKPVDFEAGKRYPLAFLIHGGPQGSFGNHFHFRWNPQTYAGAGYAVVMVDFHGSTGYGQAFTDAIRGDWGGAPYEDLMKGLDAALGRYPFLDGQRVAALGASFGGYMIYWLAGQTDRFRCLVAHDGNLDERFAYFDTEELWFPEWEHRGTPWDNPDGYRKHNPIEYVEQWKTPMLVIHGERDFRVVATQGLAAFNALQRRGIPSQLLYFPDENHWVLKPHNSIQWHETVNAWLDRWTAAQP